MHSKFEQVPFSGSIVICGIDYTNDLLLEEALRFQGGSFDPVDRVELKYEAEAGGNVLFTIGRETASVGSRIAGGPVRTKLVNLLRVTGAAQILVDFQGVSMISSSFADEVFGKTFV